MEILDTSRAKNVEVKVKDYDSIPLSAVYTDITIPASPVPIDLTNYKFEFILKRNNDILKIYSIDSGSMTSAYLEKISADKNVLNMQLMWEDLRPRTLFGSVYRLIMVVTHPTGEKYVHINYTISGGKY